MPLPADPTPVEVLYEDKHLIAVNKPAHERSAPIHRHEGTSMLNRLIHYLGYPPHVRDVSLPDTLQFFVDKNSLYCEMHRLVSQCTPNLQLILPDYIQWNVITVALLNIEALGSIICGRNKPEIEERSQVMIHPSGSMISTATVRQGPMHIKSQGPAQCVAQVCHFCSAHNGLHDERRALSEAQGA
jgi:hypothetical protein